MLCWGDVAPHHFIPARPDSTPLRRFGQLSRYPDMIHGGDLQGQHIVKQTIAHVAFLVRDYDEAIQFFTSTLNFTLVEDTYIPEQDKRWVLVAPPNSIGSMLLLARAETDQQRDAVGNQSGGRVFLFLYTDNFWRDYHQMVERGVTFVREPKTMPYGIVAVFDDLYGNQWDLLQPRDQS